MTIKLVKKSAFVWQQCLLALTTELVRIDTLTLLLAKSWYLLAWDSSALVSRTGLKRPQYFLTAWVDTSIHLRRWFLLAWATVALDCLRRHFSTCLLGHVGTCLLALTFQHLLGMLARADTSALVCVILELARDDNRTCFLRVVVYNTTELVKVSVA